MDRFTWFVRICFLVSFLLQQSLAWNTLGHELVVAIAEHHLSDNTLEKVSQVFKNSKSDSSSTIRSVVVWPDEISGNLSTLWTRTFHFVPIDDNPPHMCLSYIQNRDCPENNCIVNALTNYTMQLKDTTLSPEERAIALKFVIHLTGDAHCPPHVTAKDYLGWHSYGAWKGKVVDVHRIWDKQLIKKRVDDLGGQNAYLEYLLKQPLPSDHLRKSKGYYYYWTKSLEMAYLDDCFSSWITKTNTYLCKTYQNFHTGVEFSGDEYYDKIKTYIDVMIINAGYKLANLLEYALSGKKTIC